MTDETPNIGAYFNKLTMADKAELTRRRDRYREQLEQQGYEVTLAEGSQGFFAGVLVIDDERGRFGFLEENGSVSWLTGSMSGIGTLGSAIVQNQTERLDRQVEGLENADVE